MKLNKETEYALISLTAMAEDDRLYSARALSDQHKLPYDLTCKIMQRLANAGLLTSARGPKGGYKLAMNAADILLSAVEDAISERPNTVPCLDGRYCDRRGHCSIRGGVIRLQSKWDEMMSGISLADFLSANEVTKQGVNIGNESGNT